MADATGLCFAVISAYFSDLENKAGNQRTVYLLYRLLQQYAE